ncbi:MAG: RidA family protein [Candidatus Zhuqueibacterota bacterium]
MSIEDNIKSLGLEIPETPKPVAAYIPAVQVNDLVFTSGQLPVQKGELKFIGKLGREFTTEQGYQAAVVCVLNALSAIKNVIGDLDRIEQVVKVTGFVASAEGFTDQPAVINGASELLKKVFGEKGAHSRSAVGMAELPRGAAVELEMIVKVK